MSWSNNVASVLVIIVAIVAVASGAAAFAILVQIFRQGGWRLAEPSIIQGRWKMIGPWLLVGTVIGLLLGIAAVVLSRIDQPPPAAPKEVIIFPPSEIKSRPREVPVANDADQTPAVPSEAKISVDSKQGTVP